MTRRLILLLFITITACDKETAWDAVKTRGDAEIVHVSLPTFHAVTVENRINLVLVQGDSYSARIEGWKNLNPKIKMTVDQDGMLFIDDTNGYNFVRSRDNRTTVFLSFPDEIHTLYFKGDGYIISNDTINLSHITVYSIGASGSIDLKLKANSIYAGANQTSVTTYTIRGTTQSLGMGNWGFGPLDLSNLETSTADIHHRGTGNVYLNVSESLSATIYGAGNAYYKGDPTINLTRIGKGNLFQMKK